MTPLARHSGGGRNPVNKIIPVERDSILVLSASQAASSNWIPASAGMTSFILFDYSA